MMASHLAEAAGAIDRRLLAGQGAAERPPAMAQLVRPGRRRRRTARSAAPPGHHAPVGQPGRRAEITVGRRGLLLDPGQQVSQARLAIRRRRLDIQQPRQPARQLELLLQAQTRAPGASCPYRYQYSPRNRSLCARYARYTSAGEYGRAPASNITGVSRLAFHQRLKTRIVDLFARPRQEVFHRDRRQSRHVSTFQRRQAADDQSETTCPHQESDSGLDSASKADGIMTIRAIGLSRLAKSAITSSMSSTPPSTGMLRIS